MVNRGEIYMANLHETNGSVQHGYRPVLVVQNNVGNHNSPTTIVVPITTKKQNKHYLPVHVKITRVEQLKEESVALCEQLLTIDQSDLDTMIGSINRRKQIEINVAIAVSVIPGCLDAICRKYNVKNPLED